MKEPGQNETVKVKKKSPESILWHKSEHNKWYQGAYYTAREHTGEECVGQVLFLD